MSGQRISFALVPVARDAEDGWVLAVLLPLVAVAVAWGKYGWARQTRALIARLNAAELPASARRVDFSALDSLPVPVQRYFRAVLKDGAPIVTAVDIELSAAST